MKTKSELRLRPAALAAVALTVLLAGCGGGKDDEAGSPWLQTGQAAGAERARIASADAGTEAEVQAVPGAVDQRTTLAQYLVDRTQVAVVQGFPSPTGEEMEAVHAGSVERGIAQLLSSFGSSGNALALPALQASLVGTVAAAAQGDTLAELRRAQPEESRFYARTVQTAGVERSLWSPAGTLLNGAYLRATDLIAPLPPLASWTGAEVTTRDDAKLLTTLDGFSSEGLNGLALGADTRLLVVDRLRDRASFAADPQRLADGVFVGSDGSRRVLPMLQWPAIRHERPAYLAHLAVGPAHRHVVTIQPTSGSLQAFASSGALASAVSDLAQMARQRTLVALPAGMLALPVLKQFGVDSNPAGVRGLDLARSETNANLRGLDGGGSHLRTAALPAQLSVDVEGLSVSGGHAAAFHFSRLNIYGPGLVITQADVNGTFVSIDPKSLACPRTTADLRSLFVAVFDDDLRLVSLAAIGNPPGTPCQ